MRGDVAMQLQQLREAIPSDHSYRFLIHDRDAIFSAEVDSGGTHREFGTERLPRPGNRRRRV